MVPSSVMIFKRSSFAAPLASNWSRELSLIGGYAEVVLNIITHKKMGSDTEEPYILSASILIAWHAVNDVPAYLFEYTR